jgi:hypothetical protein
MNTTLIEQLVEESTDFYRDRDPEGGNFAQVNTTRLVELVVRACAKVIEDQDVDPSFKHRMAWAVKHKFGVSE